MAHYWCVLSVCLVCKSFLLEVYAKGYLVGIRMFHLPFGRLDVMCDDRLGRLLLGCMIDYWGMYDRGNILSLG